jgi:GNAT superfamily N-acetyltransferase
LWQEVRKISEILKSFSPRAVEQAIEANIVEQVRLLSSASPHVQIHDEPDVVWITTQVPHPFLNRVYQARFEPDHADGRIAELLAHFVSRGLPLSWHVGPSSQPHDLGRRLIAHGLSHAGYEIGMAADLRTLDESLPTPSDLVIKRVDSMPKLQQWMRVVTASFEYPEKVARVLLDVFGGPGFGEHVRWRLYVGSLDGEPVGASRLFMGAGVAGVYAVGTVPKKRRKGIGTAMTLAALGEARRLRYRIGVLRGAEMALGIYRRLGFTDFCRFGVYEWQGKTEAPEVLGKA